MAYRFLDLWTFVLEEFGDNVPDYISSLDNGILFLPHLKGPFLPLFSTCDPKPTPTVFEYLRPFKI